jgi:hypothetical protein
LPALADQSQVKAKLACETLPQLVLCVVRLVPAQRYSVTWADATILVNPAFVTPVKSKATYRRSPTKLPVMHLGFTRNGPGTGELAILVRSVACSVDFEACSHQKATVVATVSVPDR